VIIDLRNISRSFWRLPGSAITGLARFSLGQTRKAFAGLIRN